MAVVYAAVALVGGGFSIWKHGPQPFLHPTPALVLGPCVREGVSLGMGLLIAVGVIVASRVSVRRFAWAKRLHEDLRPAVLGMSTLTIVALAALSSLGEELLFRSLLVPWIGVVPQALVFGLVHQIPGPSRWVWITWATGAGLAFGGLYAVAGSLAGPLLAHATINALNLAYLRDHGPG
jgi:hypothetical protein